jgi:N-acetylgalactosamine-N,N'-diacetylbacillosaminyl-diphospho-undecaprenol 4-alpha-N-acetylgalactosaminyltransferase
VLHHHASTPSPGACDPHPAGRGAGPADLRGARLLFVINSLAGGGAERVFSTILRNSQPLTATNDVHVALLDRADCTYPLPLEVTVHQLECGGRLGASVSQLSRLARRLRPDAIVAFLNRANVAAAIAGRAANCPVIMSERNDTSAQLALGRFPVLARAMLRLSFREARQLIAVSAGVGEALRAEYGVVPDRIRVINNPVDVAAIRAAANAPADGAEDDVVMLARLEPQKNLDVAITAFAHSNWPGRLVILGEGSLRPQLRALGNRLGLGDRLVMPGFHPNPYPMLANARLFMLSSRHEGFCNSLVEAMALGVPVLAADCRFSPAEILQAPATPAPGQVVVGRGGLLVAVDDVEALAAGLRMLRDKALAARLSQDGRRRAEDFGVAAQVGRYWQVVADVLQPGRDAGARRTGVARPVLYAGAGP